MDILRGPGQHKRRAVVLQKRDRLQGILEIVRNGDDAQVKISHAQRLDEALVGAVSDLRIGHIVQRVIYKALVFINSQDLMALFVERLGNIAPKTAQTHKQNGFHNISSLKISLWPPAPWAGARRPAARRRTRRK